MASIILPKKIGGDASKPLVTTHHITVIGANGAGKSRFCLALLKDYNDKAYRVSALKALYDQTINNSAEPNSLYAQFQAMQATSPLMQSTATTDFDRLISLLIRDEFHDIMRFKALRHTDKNATLPVTKLDQVVSLWQDVFPKNRILRDGGRLLFTNDKSDSPFSAIRLSQGEKAVFYYIGAMLYAPQNAMVMVDDPETFLHRSILNTLWNVIEEQRSDCTFIYNTHDVEFTASRIDNQCIWVRNYDPVNNAWDYEMVNPAQAFSDQLYIDLLGSRKPILFIEGDAEHSIDARLYPLIFTDYTVKPMGSCNKVIEATRAFNDLASFHHLDSHGIVDRDRRTEGEVGYLRNKKIFVPNVAEIENILMLEGVIRGVADYCGKNTDEVVAQVKTSVVAMFAQVIKAQALQHVRHRVKRNVEKRIDKRFPNIDALETHMTELLNEINPRGMYDELCRKFHEYVKARNYEIVLRVFNEKNMLGDSNVAQLCGLRNKDAYLHTILTILKQNAPQAEQIRTAVKACFAID